VFNKFYLKQCKRCKGDYYLGKDNFGAYLSCLQCGCLIDIEQFTFRALLADGKIAVGTYGYKY